MVSVPARVIYSYVADEDDEISAEAGNEPLCGKTSLRDFRPGLTQTGLYSHLRWLEA